MTHSGGLYAVEGDGALLARGEGVVLDDALLLTVFF